MLHSTSLYFASDRRERRCDYIVDNDGTNRFVLKRAFQRLSYCNLGQILTYFVETAAAALILPLLATS